MMINLLPSQQKEELLQEEKLRIVLIISVIVFVSAVYVFLILFAIKIYVKGELDAQSNISLTQEERLKNPEIQGLQKNIVYANEMILESRLFYSKQPRLAWIFEQLDAVLPQDMHLNRASWQKESGQMNIAGFSPSRDTLFELKNALEDNENFEEVDFPSINWVKPRDIDFQVVFKVKK